MISSKKKLFKHEMDMDVLYFCGFNGNFDGDLDFDGTNVTHIPSNLTITGSLHLNSTYKLQHMGENIRVKWNMWLIDSYLTHLPNNIKVGGSLSLNGSSITSLPNNLFVGRVLDIEHTVISQLPDDLIVLDTVAVHGSGITHKIVPPKGVRNILFREMPDQYDCNITPD